jgi:hypothetical protein
MITQARKLSVLIKAVVNPLFQFGRRGRHHKIDAGATVN